MLRQRVNGKSGFRRIGEQTISTSFPRSKTDQTSPLDQAIEQYVAAQFGFLYDICHRYQIPVPSPEVSTPGKIGWITRRGVSQIMAQNPGIERSDALKLYLIDHPRSRTIPTPKTAKTSGQKSWVSRLQNLITAANLAGKVMTWDEAHETAVTDLLEKSRRTG